MISRYWFQTKLLPYIAQFWRYCRKILLNFGDFGGKCHFPPYNPPINRKRNNFIKHPPFVYQEAADIRDVYLYKK